MELRNPRLVLSFLGGMVPIPVAFLEFKLWVNFYILVSFTKWKRNFSFTWSEDKQIFFCLQYTRTVLVRFDSFPNCFMNILIFVTLGDIFWFYSTFFININIMLIESFCKLSFTSYNFISFNKFNIFVLYKSFVC